LVRAKGKKQEQFSWKGTAVQNEIELGSRGIAVVRSRHQEMSSEGTAFWKRLSDGAINKSN
jgi:hypothetical protein